METICEYRPDPEELQHFEARLFNYNRTKVNDYSYEDILIKTIDEQGRTIAGLHGRIGGEWFYIASLWVEPEFRKQKIGTGLLHRAENVARGRGCNGLYLYTYSFQNPGFYKKHGYHIFGKVESFCGTHEKVYLKNRFEN